MGKISKIVALSLLMSFAISQTTGKIRGKVTSADGQPLAGANVIVDGTTKGAATDGDGSYTILNVEAGTYSCLLYTSPSPRDGLLSRMPSSA